jgi:PleD family two-component response regulator
MPHAFSAIARHVPVSVGIATSVRPSLGRSWKTLVEEADMWMYEAKGRGRNRIEGFSIG